MLILYKTPGAKPSFIIPLRTSSHLRSLSMSSSSNKSTNSIVSNHIQQNGFAVLDPTERSSFFVVAASDTDYVMWVQAISETLKKKETSTLDPSGKLAPVANQVFTPISDMVQENNLITYPKDQNENPAPSTIVQPSQAPLIPTSKHLVTQDLYFPTANGPLSEHCVAVPTNTGNNSPTPIASMESSDSMEGIEMEEISLNEDLSLQLPPSTPDFQTDLSPSDGAMLCAKSSPDIHLPMRERLAKGRSKIVTSKFGSALKTGVLAASEIGRDGTKRMMEVPHKEEGSTRQGAVGQKISMLKRNATTKFAAARSTIQDHNNARADEPPPSLTNTSDLSLTSSQNSLSGNKKLAVGEKISLLKKNMINSIAQEQSVREVSGVATISKQQRESKRAITKDSPDPLPMSSFQELSLNKSSTQELRKKLVANLDQSMSNTMKSMTQFSTAVKSGVKNDPVVKQFTSNSKTSENSRQLLSAGHDTKSVKPIKYDARETFSASSEFPLKIKSLSSGKSLQMKSNLPESIGLLRKIEGNWVVIVDVLQAYVNPLENEIFTEDDSHIKPRADGQDYSELKYRITVSDIAYGTHGISETSVDRTMSEVLTLHSSISEIIAQHLPSTAEAASQEEVQHTDATNQIFSKLSPLERLRVCGNLLKMMLELPSIGSDKQCEFCPLR